MALSQWAVWPLISIINIPSLHKVHMENIFMQHISDMADNEPMVRIRDVSEKAESLIEIADNLPPDKSGGF